MNKHIDNLLEAYHDGELTGRRLRRVEEHLAVCETCRADLEALQELSNLLQVTDPDLELIPADRFVANLNLHLPRRSVQVRPKIEKKNNSWLWVPASLLIIGVVLQITYSLGFVVSMTTNSELFGSQMAWLQGEQVDMNWFQNTMNLFGDQVGSTGQLVLSAVNDAHVVIAQLTQRILPQLALAIAYLGWLFIWWFRHQDSPEQLLITNQPYSETKNGS